MNLIALAAFAAVGVDKGFAEKQRQRISEAALLMGAFFGGTPGAYAGRQVFRHKTRKQPFSSNLHFVTGLQIVLVTALSFLGWDTVLALLKCALLQWMQFEQIAANGRICERALRSAPSRSRNTRPPFCIG